jgi:hypothetical protein
MSDELKKKSEKLSATQQIYHQERTNFRALLLSNPNYFGNLAESAFKAVLPIAGNTTYEELACVGYHPQQEKLEAVVYLYQHSGYGTDLCGQGTPEYVRFYLSFDGGTTWKDQGLTSFQAHDIPGTDKRRRLEFAVSLAVSPPRKLCRFDPLIRVRAILSWNHQPPANQPDWRPIWGNVREAVIQVEPLRFPYLSDLVKEISTLKLAELEEILDPEVPLQTKTKALGAAELSVLYRDQDVPAHRFAFKELSAFIAGETALGAEQFLSGVLAGISPDKLGLGSILKTDGDTTYEELQCIGLDPNVPDTLIGVIQVKKSAGYSGGPCTAGSREYVTFWADFDGNGSFETPLGTAEVRVYDLSKVPSEGVFYAVRLPVDLSRYRRSCKEPRVVRIRAILSWSVPVPGTNPNQVPTWGNREETFISIGPGIAGAPGKIAILGGIPVSKIDGGTGLTTADAKFATNNTAPDSLGRPCPFGGRVTVQGAPLAGESYKVEVIPSGGGAPTAVVTDLDVTDLNGILSVHRADPATGRFAYLPFTSNINGVLAQWDTTGDLVWTVRLSTFDGGGNLVGTDTHVIQLDNTGPKASVEITSGTGNCGRSPAGTPISGNFVALDTYFGSYSLYVEPAVNPAGVGVPVPGSGTSPTAPAPGDTWNLDTKGMKPCGYVIRIDVADRAILDSQRVGHPNSGSAGFCLLDPVQK